MVMEYVLCQKNNTHYIRVQTLSILFHVHLVCFVQETTVLSYFNCLFACSFLWWICHSHGDFTIAGERLILVCNTYCKHGHPSSSRTRSIHNCRRECDNGVVNISFTNQDSNLYLPNASRKLWPTCRCSNSLFS